MIKYVFRKRNKQGRRCQITVRVDAFWSSVLVKDFYGQFGWNFVKMETVG